MQRDLLLLSEMIEAAERAIQLTDGVAVDELQADRLRKESLLWNFTVLGEAAAQVSESVREPDILVDQDVVEADRLADRTREWRGADAMLAEQPYCVAVIRRRPPPFGRADVLGDVYACLNRGDERVLDSPEPDGIRTAVLIST